MRKINLIKNIVTTKQTFQNKFPSDICCSMLGERSATQPAAWFQNDNNSDQSNDLAVAMDTTEIPPDS